MKTKKHLLRLNQTFSSTFWLVVFLLFGFVILLSFHLLLFLNREVPCLLLDFFLYPNICIKHGKYKSKQKEYTFGGVPIYM